MHSHVVHPHLHPFPTRRSSDLNPRRRNFRGLTYFPVSTDWVCNARFEPYEPTRRLKIVNILGMEEETQSPGAVIFTRKDRKSTRLNSSHTVSSYAVFCLKKKTA